MKYSKLIAALLAGLVVAVPILTAGAQDGHLSLFEVLSTLATFFPAVVVGLSPANKLDTADLVSQINKNPDINLVDIKADVSGLIKRPGEELK